MIIDLHVTARSVRELAGWTRPFSRCGKTHQLDLPLAAPVLGEVGGKNGSQTAREVHNGGVSLQRLVVVFAVKAAVASSGKEPLFKLGHGLDTTCGTRRRVSLLLPLSVTSVLHRVLFASFATCDTSVIPKEHSPAGCNDAGQYDVAGGFGVHINNSSCSTFDIGSAPDLAGRYILFATCSFHACNTACRPRLPRFVS